MVCELVGKSPQRGIYNTHVLGLVLKNISRDKKYSNPNYNVVNANPNISAIDNSNLWSKYILVFEIFFIFSIHL